MKISVMILIFCAFVCASLADVHVPSHPELTGWIPYQHNLYETDLHHGHSSSAAVAAANAAALAAASQAAAAASSASAAVAHSASAAAHANIHHHPSVVKIIYVPKLIPYYIYLTPSPQPKPEEKPAAVVMESGASSEGSASSASFGNHSPYQ